MSKLIIDRERWARGHRPVTELLGCDGTMCCLGFYAVSLGADTEVIRTVGTPSETDEVEWPDWLRLAPSPSEQAAEDTLIGFNDDADMSESDREQAITAEFAKHGVEVIFVDTAADAEALGGVPRETTNA